MQVKKGYGVRNKYSPPDKRISSAKGDFKLDHLEDVILHGAILLFPLSARH